MVVLFHISCHYNFLQWGLSGISSVLPLICCLVTKAVPNFLDFPSIYYTRLSRVGYSSIRCILGICMADGCWAFNCLFDGIDKIGILFDSRSISLIICYFPS